MLIPIKYRNISTGLYNACDDGKIYSVKTGKEIKPYINKRGYYYVRLVTYNVKTNTYKQRNFPKYRIIKAAFNGEDEPDMTVDHKDCNKLNDDPNNLEYVTFEENIRRAKVNGLWTTSIYDYNDELIHNLCKCYVKGYNVRRAMRYCNMIINPTTTQFAVRVFYGNAGKHVSSLYKWNTDENKRKVYTPQDLHSIATFVIHARDNYSVKDIARKFPKYDENKTIAIIKKMRQGILYKEILNEVAAMSVIECDPRDSDGFQLLVKSKRYLF